MNSGNTVNNNGAFLENAALRWLKAKGLKVVAKNYLSRAGKIDLIMLDGQTLCFIDVEYRVNQDFNSAEYGVPSSKQQEIIQTAASFINHQNKYLKYSRRFDVLIVEPDIASSFKMSWIKNEFSADLSQGK